MTEMKTYELTQYLDDLLRVDEIKDISLNGMQVENSGTVRKVALAVDASLASIQAAAEEKADLLLVHHGLFWDRPLRVTGGHYRRIRALIENDIALYAAHLPLDMHPELGNNAQVGPLMGWKPVRPFGDYHGRMLGFEFEPETPRPLDAFVRALRKHLHCDPIVWDFGNETVRRIGYVSGGAVDLLDEAVQKGLDLYITGEPKHSAYWTAREARIHVVFAGHYVTEKPGVKAVGRHLEEQSGL
ncbi:MAG TPA: Nif3-like dinuclear metal center hexameric protein, partial [bacterium]|nr:Nif3-like dinuclear metal center hexameric protein [bacterium]